MKNLIIIVAVTFALMSCKSSTESDHSQNIEVVKKYVHAVENLDFEGMGNMLDADYLGVGPSYGDSIGKDDAVANWKWNVENLYNKIHYNRSRFASVTIPDGESKGDWVANWAELEIEFKDGESVIIWANSNYLVENGKIKKSLTFYNEADVMRQLGFEMVPSERLEQ
ncbi:hypothetical protein SAMN00777080_3403 [Aquiflexum balticum DSM 16537]|uniref:SnoaL-like domain-containing protein n=1 Tax=Aquiflexum balticum DSM 16537 TaxID=758820 RepID=A0A1W2H756_9BACT|nr:nuclear transport factor 2 family protein [Aquiflexum balticum]SMD44770.1 hypothetical protein SAMN00777080_3403 [Aquiflexum balticum DSM 16537]